MSVIPKRTEKEGKQMPWIPRTAINKITFDLMQLCLYMGIGFPYPSECHRQIPFLESMSLDDVLCQLVLIKENNNKSVNSTKGSGTEQRTGTNFSN